MRCPCTHEPLQMPLSKQATSCMSVSRSNHCQCHRFFDFAARTSRAAGGCCSLGRSFLVPTLRLTDRPPLNEAKKGRLFNVSSLNHRHVHVQNLKYMRLTTRHRGTVAALFTPESVSSDSEKSARFAEFLFALLETFYSSNIHGDMSRGQHDGDARIAQPSGIPREDVGLCPTRGHHEGSKGRP